MTTAVLVGCGGISGAWLRAIREMPDVRLTGLVDIREDAARARREEFGFADAAVGSDLGTVLAETRPEVVFDCTAPEAHLDVTLQALETGSHVLGEKPLADSMEGARRLMGAARDAGRTFAVMQNRRYDARLQRLRAFLEGGALGALTTMNADFYIGAHFGGFRDHMPHVLLLDMAIHTFDAARCLGGLDPVAVYCREWNPRGSWYDRDASAVAVFEMTDGVVFTYRGSWCAEGLSTSWEAEWRLVCERGSATWDGDEGLRAERVARSGEGAFQSEREPVAVPAHDPGPKSGGHAGAIRDFVAAVREGRTPETDCADNIKSLAMVFGAIESAETGRRVEIVV